jgi:hypothetical protein
MYSGSAEMERPALLRERSERSLAVAEGRLQDTIYQMSKLLMQVCANYGMHSKRVGSQANSMRPPSSTESSDVGRDEQRIGAVTAQGPIDHD